MRGYVQGVFYRASTREKASAMGLGGWVRNLPDGNVEAVFEGPVDLLHNMIDWCREGPPGAHVTGIDEKWSDYTGEHEGFSGRY